MRRVLVVCLALAAARAGDPVADFAAAYRAATDTKARRDAIAALASVDTPAAAERLVQLWDRLDKERATVGREVDALKKKRRALEKKRGRASGDAKKRLLNEILAVEAREVAKDRRVAGIEVERYAILKGLRRMKSLDARAWFAGPGLARSRSPALLRVVAEQAARTQPGALVDLLKKERKPERLVPLLQGLAHHEAQAPRDVGPIVQQLVDRDWAVRVAAAQALVRAANPKGVGPLVAALGREKPRSRAALEMVRALTRLTGQKLGPYADHWARWWAENGARVEAGQVPLGKGEAVVGGKQEQGHFYGIPQDVDRIIYVFDKSGSMEVSMENPRWEGKSPVPAYDNEDSRFDAAQRELLRAVKRLRKGSAFAVIIYSSRAKKLHDKLVPATPAEHAKLEKAMARVGPEGSTNIYEALDMALRMANVHSLQTRGEQRADAIFLVSDGAPTNAKGESEDPERILQAVREWNAMKRIAIHCIGIGKEHGKQFLSQLAAENGGSYYAVLPKKK